MKKINLLVLTVALASLVATEPAAVHAAARKHHPNYLAQAVLLPPKAGRGKTVFNRSCKSCHSMASRFKGYKKAAIKGAIRSQPMMSGINLSAQQLADLVEYLKGVK
ncbi:MAG: cytochrome c [Oligoflexia bacterium]|nr:cytochrome c [Oligoflexia bacterium]